MSNKEELANYLKEVQTIGKEEYQKIAELFEKVVVEDILEIWKSHKSKINMRLNNIPEPETILRFMDVLGDKLLATKKKY